MASMPRDVTGTQKSKGVLIFWDFASGDKIVALGSQRWRSELFLWSIVSKEEMSGTNVEGRDCVAFCVFRFSSASKQEGHSKPRRECGKTAAAFASFVYLCSRRLRQF